MTKDNDNSISPIKKVKIESPATAKKRKIKLEKRLQSALKENMYLWDAIRCIEALIENPKSTILVSRQKDSILEITKKAKEKYK